MQTPKTICGTLSVHFEGYGFVSPMQPGQPDIFVPARFIGEGLHGDWVEASVQPSKRGLFEGKILKVLKRRLNQLVGRLEHQGKRWLVISEDTRIRHQLVLDEKPTGAEAGDYIVARIEKYPLPAAVPAGRQGRQAKGEEGSFSGTFVRKLPKRGGLQAEIDFVIAKHQWPTAFPPEVLEGALACKRDGLETDAKESRKDLRHLPFVTIDGADAKDFDDAVCAQALPGGQIRVWVAIADVSHFVRTGSVLDQEAFQRSTSVYFPGRVLPMLPEVISNDLCSLVPQQDRFALCAELDLDGDGHPVRSTFYPAIFQSHARLTYKIVKQILEDKLTEVREAYANILPMLETLEVAARRLKAKRAERGSLDFDLPEPEVILDFTGGIENIEKAERYFSHQLIEELMVAANEAVAEYLTQRRVGCVYRIHEKPDPQKVFRFHKVVSNLGFKTKLATLFTGQGLRKVIQHFKDHPEQRLVNTLLLRSMSQAVYSNQNLGHFGLASRCYCHFTSPIRRYPDLIVHRLLRSTWQGKSQRVQEGLLHSMAEHCSLQERVAMGAEREMLSLHSTLFMLEKRGEKFAGIISHVTKFGFFVELLDFFVEGLVRKESLANDRYLFDEDHLLLKGERRKKVFKMGDRVVVAVGEVSIEERRIYFNWLDTPG